MTTLHANMRFCDQRTLSHRMGGDSDWMMAVICERGGRYLVPGGSKTWGSVRMRLFARALMFFS